MASMESDSDKMVQEELKNPHNLPLPLRPPPLVRQTNQKQYPYTQSLFTTDLVRFEILLEFALYSAGLQMRDRLMDLKIENVNENRLQEIRVKSRDLYDNESVYHEILIQNFVKRSPLNPDHFPEVSGYLKQCIVNEPEIQKNVSVYLRTLNDVHQYFDLKYEFFHPLQNTCSKAAQANASSVPGGHHPCVRLPDLSKLRSYDETLQSSRLPRGVLRVNFAPDGRTIATPSDKGNNSNNSRMTDKQSQALDLWNQVCQDLGYNQKEVDPKTGYVKITNVAKKGTAGYDIVRAEYDKRKMSL